MSSPLARHTLLATASGQSGINSDLNAHTLAAAVIVEAQPTTGACFSFTSAFTLCGEAGNCSTVAC